MPNPQPIDQLTFLQLRLPPIVPAQHSQEQNLDTLWKATVELQRKVTEMIEHQNTMAAIINDL